MLWLFFALLFLLLPVSATVDGRIHNLKVELLITFRFLGLFPLKISLYNLKGERNRFCLRGFGKTRYINKKAGGKNKSVKDKMRNFKLVWSKAVGSIEFLEITGKAGIFGNGAATAIVTGYINGIVCFLPKGLGIEKFRVGFESDYGFDGFEMKVVCIFSTCVAKIIYESVCYYLQRRK